MQSLAERCIQYAMDIRQPHEGGYNVEADAKRFLKFIQDNPDQELPELPAKEVDDFPF